MRSDFTWMWWSAVIAVTVVLVDSAAIDERNETTLPVAFPKDDNTSKEPWNSRWRPEITKSFEIPESLLLGLKDVSNFTDFVNQYLDNYTYYTTVSPDTVNVNPETGVAARVPLRRRPSPTLVPESASCIPTKQIVEFKKSDDPLVILWPSCTRIERCGGCCSSSLLSCQPNETTTVKYKLIRARYPYPGATRFQHDGFEDVTVEKHERCECDCKQKAHECTPLQEHKDCRCVCKNLEAAKQCTGYKFWDSTDCQCKCKEQPECSTGLYFNVNSCRCEILKGSRRGPFGFRMLPPKLSSPYTDDRESEQSRHHYVDVPMQEENGPFPAPQYKDNTKPVLIYKFSDEHTTTRP